MLNVHKTLMLFRLLFVLFCSTISTSKAFANTAFVNHNGSLLKCSEEKAELKRLACFDSLVAKIKNKVNRKQADKLTLVFENSAKIDKNNVRINSVSTIPSISTDFGQEHKLKQQEVALKQVEFIIKSATLSLRKNWHLIFENGQIWYATESNNFIKFKTGNIVIIKRGVLNSFYMKKKGNKRSIRAKRIR